MSFPAGGGVLPGGCFDKSGGVVGGQIGYRWQQPNNNFVLGVEAQGDWANLNRSQVSFLDPTLTLGNKVEAMGLFTAQIGWAGDRWLWYFKGGAAVTNNTVSVSVTLSEELGSLQAGSTRWGGVGGYRIRVRLLGRTGRSGLNTTISMMGGQDFTFPGIVNPPVRRWARFTITQDRGH